MMMASIWGSQGIAATVAKPVATGRCMARVANREGGSRPPFTNVLANVQCVPFFESKLRSFEPYLHGTRFRFLATTHIHVLSAEDSYFQSKCVRACRVQYDCERCAALCLHHEICKNSFRRSRLLCKKISLWGMSPWDVLEFVKILLLPMWLHLLMSLEKMRCGFL